MAKIMAEGYVSGGQGAFGTLAWCDRDCPGLPAGAVAWLATGRAQSCVLNSEQLRSVQA